MVESTVKVCLNQTVRRAKLTFVTSYGSRNPAICQRSGPRPQSAHLQTSPYQYRQFIHACKPLTRLGLEKVWMRSLKQASQMSEAERRSIKSAISWKGSLSGVAFCLLLLIVDQSLRDNTDHGDSMKSTEHSTGSFGGLLQRALSGITSGPSINISPLEFSKFSLDYIQPITKTTSVFCFSRPPFTEVDAKYFDMWWKAGVWSVEIKQPDMQISRHYTPLPPCLALSESDDFMIQDKHLQLRFLVKKEEGGEVSSWLFRQNGSYPIEMRGPHVEYELPYDVSEILFLAGGTGVAPALQIAHALQQRDQSNSVSARANMRLVWANRQAPDISKGDKKVTIKSHSREPDTPADQILMRRIRSLQKLQDRVRLDVDMYCDSDGQYIRQGDLHKLVSIANKRHAESDSVGRKIILVSGPDGFVEYLSGKKPSEPSIWTSKSKLALGGLLSSINLAGWEVVKL